MKKIIPFVISFLCFEVLELILAACGFDLMQLGYWKIGSFGLVLFFGLKYHIFCCLFPAIFLFWRQRKCSCQGENHAHSSKNDSNA